MLLSRNWVLWQDTRQGTKPIWRERNLKNEKRLKKILDEDFSTGRGREDRKGK